MELRHIRYFLAVARECNFTRAAAHLNIAQPPLSAQIKQLEAEIGATLFHRVPTGAILTEAGRAFQEIVRDVPRTIERAVVAAQRGSRGETGRIRIGFSGTAVFTSLVPAAIKRFREEHPDALVSLVELHSGALAKSLLNGEVDVAFLRWFGPCDRSLEMEVVAEEAVLAVLPVDHPAATGDLELTMLRDETFILVPPSSGPLNDIVVSACRRSGFEPRLGEAPFQIGSIVSMVAAGLGISFVPSSMDRFRVDGIVFRRVGDVELPIRVVLAKRRGETSPIVRNFVRYALRRDASPG